MGDRTILEILQNADMTTGKLAELIGVSRQIFNKSKNEFEQSGVATNKKYNALFSIISKEESLNKQQLLSAIDFVNVYFGKDHLDTDLSNLDLKTVKLLNSYYRFGESVINGSEIDFDVDELIKGIGDLSKRKFYHNDDLDDFEGSFLITNKYSLYTMIRKIDRLENELDDLKRKQNPTKPKRVKSKKKSPKKYRVNHTIHGEVVTNFEFGIIVGFDNVTGFVENKELSNVSKSDYPVGTGVTAIIKEVKGNSIRLRDLQID